jgi:hypothetical protein
MQCYEHGFSFFRTANQKIKMIEMFGFCFDLNSYKPKIDQKI